MLTRLLPFALLIAGCGGSDDNDNSSTPSRFQGSYSGTYEAPFLEDTGTYDVEVSRSGSVTGTGTSDNGGSGNLSGRFSSSGAFTGSINFPSNGTRGSLSGVLSQQTDGSLTGTLTEVYEGRTGDVTVVLTPNVE